MVRLQVCVLALSALCLCSGGRGAERVEDEEDGDDGVSRSCRDVKQALVERGVSAVRINQHQTAGKSQTLLSFGVFSASEGPVRVLSNTL